MNETVHGTCVCVTGIGVLFVGPSGSGKSDIALRMIDAGGGLRAEGGTLTRLVSDDRVAVRAVGAVVTASAPETIAGRLEVRGVGILRVPYLAETAVRLVVRLVRPEDVARMPDREASRFSVCGLALPLICLAPFESSAPAKVRAAADAVANAGFAEWLEVDRPVT